MTRNGKIARLPQSIREQINRRLQNGQPGKQIVAWLNTLPEVAAVMAADFDGQPINEPNLSHWRLGGYQDWEIQQDALEVVRRVSSPAGEISQAAPPSQFSQAAPDAQLADLATLCQAVRLALSLPPVRSSAAVLPKKPLLKLKRS